MLIKTHLKHEFKYFLCRKHFKHSIHILHNLNNRNHPQLEDKLSLVLGDVLRILDSNLDQNLPQRIDVNILVELEESMVGILTEEGSQVSDLV